MSLLRFFRQPLVKKTFQVAVIMGTGDLIAQSVVEKKTLAEINLKRTKMFASVGLLFVGPTLYVWYGTLDRMFSPRQKPLIRALKKMAVDQLIFAPIFTAALIFVFGTLNGEKIDRVIDRLKGDYPSIMMRNYMLWPAAQMINFFFVPVQDQVVFAQLIALIWNIYISMVLNK